MTRFGDFEPLCRNVPSYPWCNLFYREVGSFFFFLQYISISHTRTQLQHHAPAVLLGASFDAKSAPVGIDPKCGIPRTGSENSIGNVANIIACALSIVVTLWLIYRCNHRKAAVGTSFLSCISLVLTTQLVRPCRAPCFPRRIPCHTSPPTHHHRLFPPAGHHHPRRLHCYTRGCGRRPLLDPPRQCHYCHSGC